MGPPDVAGSRRGRDEPPTVRDKRFSSRTDGGFLLPHRACTAGRPGRVGIGQGELILCAGEMIAEESTIESPKPPRAIRSNCFTSRPAAPLSH